MQQSVASAEAMPDRLLLLGISRIAWKPTMDGFNAAFNSTDPPRTRSMRSRHFSKTGVAQADAALRAGGLWNTLVLTARMDALWQAGWDCFPDMMPHFERLGSAWNTPNEAALIEDVYREMPSYNISSICSNNTRPRGVMELTGALSDWGKPERIAETIRRIGTAPTFPLDCLDRPFNPNPVPPGAKAALATVPAGI